MSGKDGTGVKIVKTEGHKDTGILSHTITVHVKTSFSWTRSRWSELRGNGTIFRGGNV